MIDGPVAVTGARGRLGSALVGLLTAEGRSLRSWSRPEYDLDRPRTVERLVRRDRPAVVIHTAAWTDVDGCARDPALARRRNSEAVGTLARACRDADSGLVLISTNEVFDGARRDGHGYVETDPTAPPNPYGASKLDGERLAAEAFGVAPPALARGLWIVRTAWLFGPPGADFPRKILETAAGLPAGSALRVVRDEVGSPTYARDLARAIVRLLEAAPGGLFHLVNGGTASRYEWAARVLRRCGRRTPLEPIERAAYQRPSSAPAWAVLDAGRARAQGVELRGWEAAFEDYAPSMCA